jgi:tetratricopeptide (TPR) repeat protein
VKQTALTVATLAATAIFLLPTGARADCPACLWDTHDTEGHHAFVAGDLAAAESHFEKAHAAADSFLSGDVRHVESLRDLAMMRERAGDPEGAIAYELRALDAITDGMDRLRFDALGARERLAGATLSIDRLDASATHRAKAIELRQLLYGQNDPYVAAELLDLANIYRELDHLDKAITSTEAAVAIRRANKDAQGENQLLLGAALDTLSTLYIKAGRDAAAAEALAEVVAIDEGHLGPDHAFVAGTMERLAEVLKRLGRDGEADEVSSRAMDIRARTEHAMPESGQPNNE